MRATRNWTLTAWAAALGLSLALSPGYLLAQDLDHADPDRAAILDAARPSPTEKFIVKTLIKDHNDAYLCGLLVEPPSVGPYGGKFPGGIEATDGELDVHQIVLHRSGGQWRSTPLPGGFAKSSAKVDCTVNGRTIGSAEDIRRLLGAGTSAGPLIVTAEAKPTPVQVAAIKTALSLDPDYKGLDWRRFTVGSADLSGNGQADLIAHFQSSDWCGSGGCTAVVLLKTASGYSSKAIQLPSYSDSFKVLATVHNGMHDLQFDDSHVVFKWDGKNYQ